ncbi:MAG TPA: hypothetical protein EYG29_05810 [Methylococcales bacterium]|nr:hypothetical protein [Methylococcales bacterium]
MWNIFKRRGKTKITKFIPITGTEDNVTDSDLLRVSENLNFRIYKLESVLQEFIRQQEQLARLTNGLITQNMMAIVRLEIAQSTDQIIAIALETKRETTGSSNAEMALNATATLAAIGVNFLTAGNMSLLGSIILSATPEAIKAASNNDPLGLINAFTDAADIDIDDILKKEVTKNLNEAEKNALITSIDAIKEQLEGQSQSSNQNAKETTSYKPIRKKTAWIAHGAGGTAAITSDVIEAIGTAFGAQFKKLNDQLDSHSLRKLQPNEIDPTDLAKESTLVYKISNPQDTTLLTSLHPMTQEVLSSALEILSTSRSSHYASLKGHSGLIFSYGTLQKAQRKVQQAYLKMQNGLDEGQGLSFYIDNKKA